MPTVDHLLRSPAGQGLTLVAGPWDARQADGVAIVDAMSELGAAPAGAIALLTRHASSLAAGYQLDVALRVAGERGLAAVAVYGEATTSITAVRLADRARIALLAIAHDRDLGALAFGLEHAIRADAGEAMARASRLLDELPAAERAGTEAVLATASEAAGDELRVAAEPGEGASAAIWIGGRLEGHVIGPHGDAPTRIAVRLAADAIARVRARERRGLLEPARARAEALAELILAPDRRMERFADRATDLGVPVPGWHVVARLAIAHEPGTAAEDGREREVALSEAAVDVIASMRAPWHPARVESTLVLVRPWTHEPQRTAVAAAVREAGAILDRLRGVAGGATLYCGLAGPRQGAAGLRTCATEALTALGAARSLQRPHVPVSIDDVTLPRTLLEWLSSDAGQVSTRRVLRPLDDLGPARSLAAVRTLHAYLDEQGSLARCAERLHLHRNAVAYRMRQIRERLETDLDDPDQRLTLQLACRARLLSVAGEDG